MLKINLLPPYINQRSKIRTAWTLMAVVLAAEIAGLTYFQLNQINTENQLISDVQSKEQQVQQVEKLKTDADALRAKVKPIKDKTDFINQLFDFNKVRPNLYEHVASYIYREVWISGMNADQNVLTMPAAAKSISAVGRFLLFMQNNPDFTQVRISSVPGWPSGTAGVEASPLTGGGGPAGGPGGSGGPAGGAYGSGGGPPGAPPGGSGGPAGGPPVMGPSGGGSGGGAPGFGGPPGSPSGAGLAPPIFGAGADNGGPGLMNVPAPGQPGGDAVTGGGAPIPYPADLGQPKPLPVYFGFTVTGTLAKPIVRPTFQATGAGGADTGPYGSGGGMMGSGGPAGSGGPYMSGGPGGSGGPYSSGGPPGGPK